MISEQKVAVVTGGSRGIGKAIAQKLAEQGFAVAILYEKNEVMAREVVEEISSKGGKANAYCCNVLNYADVKTVIKQINDEMGVKFVLVNNAGVIRDGVLASLKESDYDLVVDTSLKGAFNMIKCCYFGFIRARKGKIINISSIAGLVGNAGQSNYAAAKAGLIGLTKSIARELGERNICCNAVAPGLIETDMTADLQGKNGQLESIPLKRIGTVTDVANVVGFLASEESDYITGEVIRVDGGLAM